MHGIDGEVYNLISDRLVTVNALFAFLSEGQCLKDSVGHPLFVCWSHRGSYLAAVSVRLADGSTVMVEAGGASEGFADVIIGSDQTLSVGSNVTIGSGGMTISYTDIRHITISHAGLYTLTLQNSDQFINILALEVGDRTRLRNDIQSHGLIGQTWRAGIKGKQVKEVEGMVDDYVVEGGLMGCEFVYSHMGC